LTDLDFKECRYVYCCEASLLHIYRIGATFRSLLFTRPCAS